jgi:predicted DNA-binding protein
LSTTPPEAALPVATPPQPEVSAPDPVPIQSKEPSPIGKLQAPDKEATVRFTVDMSETLHRKLSMLAARTGRKKVDIVRMLLEDGLKEVEGKDSLYIDGDRCTGERGDRFFMLAGRNKF